ncbi:MAG: DUF3500 domain-containing protein [Armatimonas sp.]
MKQRLALALALTLGLGGWAAYARQGAKLTPAPATDATTTKVTGAANAFLATLTPEQKKAVSYAYDNARQRANWSNFPVGMGGRGGLRMGSLTEPQQKAVHALLQTVLSKSGYQKVVDIMNADEVLRQTEGDGPGFGKANYYVSLMGTPSATAPWRLQFGGHHLAINATVQGPEITLAPSLPAAQPAHYTLNGKTIQPLGREMTKGFAMVQSLDAEQKKKAVRATFFIDLVLGPGQDGKKIAPEGIPASELTDAQKKLLLDLIAEWVGNVNDEDAAVKQAEVKKNIDKTYFAWGGSTTPGSAAYYRISGPTIWIEYSPQNLGGDPTNHTHCIYRDPTNDYGIKSKA